MAQDYWQRGTTARWVEAIICISGVLNGSTLTYNLGCDKRSGLLTGPIGDFIGSGIQLLGGLTRGQARNFYDWGLDQWIDPTKVSGGSDLITKLKASHFAKGRDNLAYDMTLKGSQAANRRFKTQDDCYYLSIVTEQTSSIFFPYDQTPTPVLMNLVLWSSSLYQGSFVDFDSDESPLEGWGSGELTIENWRENDGAVSSISQRFPFTGGERKRGGEGIAGREAIERGKWYYEKAEAITGASFDHLDVVFGYKSDPALGDAHRNLYRVLANEICRLS
ncbi:hypothetical protein [Methyloterricola oryzae]|uniref:hypothetical protein n=1 Tax=Methyloterricola oryzae TaxID=1495050 RepID=UPI00069A13D4|nr:hypothetical protein [Methyloterricola oryzae]